MFKNKEEMMYRAPLAIVGVFIFIMGILAWPGLTAFTGIAGNNAGQGADVVEGFVVTNISYDATPSTNDPNAIVLKVSFDIARDGTNSYIPVNFSNAGVFVQLRDGSTRSEWGKCLVEDGYAQCSLEPQSQMDVEDIDGLSVVAYDSDDDNIPFVASGGDSIYEITVNGIRYRVHEFTTPGTRNLDVSSISLAPRVEYLIVGAGGAGGGGWAGGGGGAGGVYAGITTGAVGVYSVTVGTGGTGGGNQGGDGGSSSAFGVTAPGGGGGGGRSGAGRSGASGGGGGWEFGVSGAERSGGNGTLGWGYKGGKGISLAANSRGGGGGGFTGAGQNYQSTAGGNGGGGYLTSLTGSSRCVAGGGGGGAESASHSKGTGTCGGGSGGRSTSEAVTAVTQNSGGGGGGAAGASSTSGGNGAHGIVIIRYRIN